MSLDLEVQKNLLNQSLTLVKAVSSVDSDVTDCLGAPPDFPTRLYDRHDLARVFGKHRDTVHRWEQDGWIKAVRKPSGRILGYPADQVAAVALRLFTRFGVAYSDYEAEKLGLGEILKWVQCAFHTARQLKHGQSEPILDILALAALADSPAITAKKATAEDLAEYLPEAKRQLINRMSVPEARGLLVRAWRQSGLIARVVSEKT